MHTSTIPTRVATSRAMRAATAIVGLLGAGLTEACSDGPDRPTVTEPAITAQVVSAAAVPAVLQRIVAISGDVDPNIPKFGASIGSPDNKNAVGLHAATGRREINWDGVPAAFTNTNTFPANFFNKNAPRGAVYEAEGGTGLRVSDNNFADVEKTYGKDLIPFSEPRMFAPRGTNQFELRFRIPGTSTPAMVRSFGAVVVDVDKKYVSRLKAFDRYGKLLANVAVPVRKNPDEYSLVGVTFSKPVIARVILVLGDTPIGKGIKDVSSGGTKDVVVLDDFLYSEPQPIQ
jgi:hypothetical protein